MQRVTTVIIGAGQAGLAMSRILGDQGVDHVVLERGDVANSWRKERWDSLRLLTPNWQSRLPGNAYQGQDPDGFMTMPQVVRRLSDYATESAAPVMTGTRVIAVRASGGHYLVETTRGKFACATLVIASGTCNLASVPAFATSVPARIRQVSPLDYKRPEDLPEGGVMVVGGSATGAQLAREIRASGRQVILSVGEHVRAPRRYRGRDIMWWMDRTGVMDQGFRDADDLSRVRRLPSLQLVGSRDGMIDLNTLQAEGVEVVGRLSTIRDGRALFSGGLANNCALADLKLGRLLATIDEWADGIGAGTAIGPRERFAPTAVSSAPRLDLDLSGGEIGSVVWATGYRPDHSWLDLPVFDRKGRLKHDGGVVTGAPGVYALGLPFLRRRKSTFIDGVGADAADLAGHLAHHLGMRHAA